MPGRSKKSPIVLALSRMTQAEMAKAAEKSVIGSVVSEVLGVPVSELGSAEEMVAILAIEAMIYESKTLEKGLFQPISGVSEYVPQDSRSKDGYWPAGFTRESFFDLLKTLTESEAIMAYTVLAEDASSPDKAKATEIQDGPIAHAVDTSLHTRGDKPGYECSVWIGAGGRLQDELSSSVVASLVAADAKADEAAAPGKNEKKKAPEAPNSERKKTKTAAPKDKNTPKKADRKLGAEPSKREKARKAKESQEMKANKHSETQEATDRDDFLERLGVSEESEEAPQPEDAQEAAEDAEIGDELPRNGPEEAYHEADRAAAEGGDERIYEAAEGLSDDPQRFASPKKSNEAKGSKLVGGVVLLVAGLALGGAGALFLMKDRAVSKIESATQMAIENTKLIDVRTLAKLEEDLLLAKKALEDAKKNTEDAVTSSVARALEEAQIQTRAEIDEAFNRGRAEGSEFTAAMRGRVKLMALEDAVVTGTCTVFGASDQVRRIDPIAAPIKVVGWLVDPNSYNINGVVGHDADVASKGGATILCTSAEASIIPSFSTPEIGSDGGARAKDESGNVIEGRITTVRP